MTRTGFAAVVALVATLAACDLSSVGPATDHSKLAIAAGDPSANASVSGQVNGVVMVDGRAVDQPLEGATIKVLAVVQDPDTTRSHLVGTVLSNAAGQFSLTDVPAGDYLLQAYPPDGSGFAGTSEWAVSSDGGSTYTVVIRLYKP